MEIKESGSHCGYITEYFENLRSLGFSQWLEDLLSFQLAGNEEYKMPFQVWRSHSQRKFVLYTTDFQIFLQRFMLGEYLFIWVKIQTTFYNKQNIFAWLEYTPNFLRVQHPPISQKREICSTLHVSFTLLEKS